MAGQTGRSAWANRFGANRMRRAGVLGKSVHRGAVLSMPASVRLWTLQRQCIWDVLQATGRVQVDWGFSPVNWRIAYRWMAERLGERIQASQTHAPVWCWHSCNGTPGGRPTVWTARALLCDYDFEQGIVLLTLSVPEELTLLSSYLSWNEFLDYVIVNERVPEGADSGHPMFQPPLIKHRTDDVQAVIPYLDVRWIESAARIAIGTRSDDEWLC